MVATAPKGALHCEKVDTEAMSNMRHHLLRMHPFLKHKMFSKSMRSFISRPRTHVFKRRWKRERLRKANRDEDELENLDTSQLLKQVLRDVHELKNNELGNRGNEGPCAINGSWFGEVAGREFVFKNMGECGYVQVALEKPPHKKRRGFMGTESWNISARLPFPNKPGYLVLNAINWRKRKVATFMGQCLICRNRPLITGQWSVAHHSRDCESLGATNELFGDVWRKDTTKELKEKNRHTSLCKALDSTTPFNRNPPKI